METASSAAANALELKALCLLHSPSLIQLSTWSESRQVVEIPFRIVVAPTGCV